MSFYSSTLYLTLECQLLAFGFSLLRVAFSWSRGVYLYDEGLLLECAGGNTSSAAHKFHLECDRVDWQFLEWTLNDCDYFEN